MEARLVREELQKCHRGEGVNHYANCKELAERYTDMIRENKVSAFRAEFGLFHPLKCTTAVVAAGQRYAYRTTARVALQALVIHP